MTRKEKTVDFVKRMIARFQADEVPALGAQLSYYLVLSFFPFLIFTVTLLGFAQVSGDQFIQEMVMLLPTETANTVTSILDEVAVNSSGTVLSFGILGTIWAASNGVNAMMKGLNKAYDEEETRPFWKVRGISIILTLVLSVVIILAMVLLIFGRGIGSYLFELLEYPSGFESTWNIVKVVVPLLGMILVFTMLFWIAPNRKIRIKDVIPGAIFTTFGWIVTSLGFSFYVNNFGNYTNTYGSIGGVIVLLIWLYISSIIIITGGEINAALTFRREGREKAGTKTFSMDLPWAGKKSDDLKT
ncbi:YihY/virulence factor BrkB family protein [Paenibacillus daejeonensis]|uniref:YihY/virulence factor BrkB family protein n=1 Tax=Paenibacillus daejeonensis TaxID=135193 RepID=UPI00036C9786|nr:YihY/virulence factor BrkB family protein [Paenibacillus daejeonensis]